MTYKIAIVSGSARIGRRTPKAVDYLARLMEQNERIEEVKILDVLDYNFPIMEERRGRNPDPPPRLDEFGEILEQADALVFASPEYNGSFSGSIKNTLDYFYKEYSKKPIGIVTVSNGMRGGINASHDLQKYILSLGAYPMPYKLLVANVSKAFDEEGNPVEESLDNGFRKFISELLWLAEGIGYMRKKKREAASKL